MRLRSIQVRLVLTYLVLIFFSTTVTFVFFLPRINEYLQKRAADQLRAQSQVLGNLISGNYAYLDGNLALVAQDLKKNFADVLQMRVRVYDPEGVLVADSATDAVPSAGVPSLENDAHNALLGQQVTWVDPQGERTLHVTNPLRAPGRIFGVVDISAPLQDRETMDAVRRQTLLALLVSGVATWIVSLLLSRTLLGPIARIQGAARRIARGELSMRLPVSGGDELALLSATINDMAAQLESRIGEIVSERNKMNTLLEALLDGVVAADRENKVVFLNTEAERLVGVSSEQAIGQPVVGIVKSPDLVSVIEECASTARLVSREIQHEGNILRVYAVPFQDQRREHHGTMTVIRDITDLRRLEEARSQFLGAVSHELRTPLTIIKGFVVTILDNPAVEADPELKMSLEMIDRESDRLSRLVEDVLELSRLRSRKMKLELAPLDAEAAVRETLQVLMAHAERVGVNLEPDVAPTPTQIMADGDRFRQIAINLIDNAIKYTPSGGDVCVRTRRVDSEWVLEIEDSGLGIPKDEIPFLFERFFRGNDKKKKEARGTGLGLAIVRELVDGHRARITVESEPNVGTTVGVWFPCAPTPG